MAARGGIILDPSTIITGRAELSLNDLGLEQAQEGADFGESAIETQLSRQAIGSVVTDRHLEPVEMTIPLIVRDDAERSLAEVQQPVEQKIGRWHEEGGWLQRDFADAAGFAGSVAYQILKASLSGLQGWAYEHKEFAPDVVLKALRSPLCYATVEAESEVFKSAEGARELIFTLAEILGTAPGLIRIRITNEGEEDWRALIFAGESRDMAQDETADTTAALAYDAVDLTLLSGTVEAEREGEKVARHSNLNSDWLSVLGSEIAGVGHMTHKGVRRPWSRIWSPLAEAELRLLYRSLGTLQWSPNPPVSTPSIDDWARVDLGECRLEPPVLGDGRWEFQIQARAPNGSGTIEIQRINPLPTEQFALVKTSPQPSPAEEEVIKTPSTVADGGSSVGTVAWAGASNAKVSDDTRASVTFSGEGQSHYLEASGFGFTIPTDAYITGVVVVIEKRGVSGTLEDASIRLLLEGTVQGDDKKKAQRWSTSDEVSSYGGSESRWGLPLIPSNINASDFGAVFSVQNLLAGAGLAEVDAMSMGVFYGTEGQNRIAFAGRSIEFRSDGIFRQHPKDDIWGELIPEGFLPYASPSGLEGRKSRFIVIPSQGDLGELPDGGSNPSSAQSFARPSYLFARESAA